MKLEPSDGSVAWAINGGGGAADRGTALAVGSTGGHESYGSVLVAGEFNSVGATFGEKVCDIYVTHQRLSEKVRDIYVTRQRLSEK
eukprot:9011294-Pyramimonas_sp.AAC.1